MGEPLVSELDELVGEVTAALSATDDVWRSTVLFGHSMGAIIAHETALALEEAGSFRPAELFVSGRRGPGGGARGDAAVRVGRPRPRTDDEILTSLRCHGGTPMELFDDPSIRMLFLRVLRNDYLLVDSYWPPAGRKPLTAGITALWGRQDPVVDAELIQLWSRCTTGEFRERAFDGGHFYLVPHLARVVELVQERFRTLADAR